MTVTDVRDYRPMNLSERLERMARAADEHGEDLIRRSEAARENDPDDDASAEFDQAFIFAGLAQVLRAGIDPSEPLREENIRG